MSELEFWFLVHTNVSAKITYYQKDIAQEAGMPPSKVANVLRGKRPPNAWHCIQICRAISRLTGADYDKLITRMLAALEMDCENGTR